MRIEITKSTSEEIRNILRSFPHGNLGVENDIIYWETTDQVPIHKPQEIKPVPRQQVAPQGQAPTLAQPNTNPVKNMKDYLFDAFA